MDKLSTTKRRGVLTVTVGGYVPVCMHCFVVFSFLFSLHFFSLFFFYTRIGSQVQACLLISLRSVAHRVAGFGIFTLVELNTKPPPPKKQTKNDKTLSERGSLCAHK